MWNKPAPAESIEHLATDNHEVHAMKLLGIAVAAIGFLGVSLAADAASAASGYVTANVNERAGPGTNFPPITVIPAGAPVTIYGCLSDDSWCDISWNGYRGWMYSAYLQVTYNSRRVGLAPAYIAPLGIPFITFEVGSYWDNHYRNRSFYSQRSKWKDFRPGNNDWHPGPNNPPKPPFVKPPIKHDGQYNGNNPTKFDGKKYNNPKFKAPTGNGPTNKYKRRNGNDNDNNSCFKDGKWVCSR
jgi:uncharacterized protein YraI